MPKLIEKAREHILQCADRELAEKGYESLTMRGIASECGLAVGTVYNYFHAKDEIVFFVMRRDWDEAMSRIGSIADEAERSDTGASKDGAVDALLQILKNLHGFVSKYKGTWRLIASSPRESASETIRSYDRTGFISALEEKIARVLAARAESVSHNAVSFAAEPAGMAYAGNAASPGAAHERFDFLARFVTAAFTRFAMDDDLDEASMRHTLKKLI